MPVFQNIKINTQQDAETINNFFRNPFGPGPGTDTAKVVLPDDTVPVFLVVGDSTSLGQTSINQWEEENIRPYVDRQGDDWPLISNDGSAAG